MTVLAALTAIFAFAPLGRAQQEMLTPEVSADLKIRFKGVTGTTCPTWDLSAPTTGPHDIVSCTKDGAPVDYRVDWNKADLPSQLETPILAPDYSSPLWSTPLGRRAFGPVDACAAYETPEQVRGANSGQPKGGCVPVPTPDGGVSLKVTHSDGKLRITGLKGKSVVARMGTCDLNADSKFPLVLGARRNPFFLRSSLGGPACLAHVNSKVQIARIGGRDFTFNDWHVWQVPDDLPLGAQEAELLTSDRRLVGKVVVSVVRAPSLDGVTVLYTGVGADAPQPSPAAAAKDGGFIGVSTPDTRGSSGRVINRLSLTYPSELGTLANATGSVTTSQGTTLDKNGSEYGAGSALNGLPAHVDITFSSTIAAPVHLGLSLSSVADAIGGEAKYEFSIVALVAVRSESIPAQLGQFLVLRCGDTDVRSGEIRAVHDRSIPSGECQVRASCEALSPTKAWLLGPQVMRASIRRGDSAPAENVFTTPSLYDVCAGRFGKRDAEAPLLFSLPPFKSDADGLFRVSVRPESIMSSTVTYRPEYALASGEPRGEVADFTFNAQLRPRGLFGYACHACVRTYVTASVAATSMRFPTKASRLNSSSSNETVEILPPTLGVLVSVEPWNYDSGTNLTPVGLVGQGGLTFFTLGDEDVSISWVHGVGFRLPLATDSSSQLGTSIVLGVFHEMVLGQPADEMHHLLVQLGLNVGTLLSGPEKQ